MYCFLKSTQRNGVKTMKLSRILPLILVALAGMSVLAQEVPRTFEPNTIYVGADGKFEADPDTAVINFNIGAQEKQLKDAYARAKRAAEQIRDVLKTNGIDPKEAEISSFQVSPIYDWKSAGKRKAVAYRVSSSVTVKLKDFDKVAPIADALGEIDVTDTQSINYTLENTAMAKARAVEDATRNARANAEVVAKAGGRTIGNLIYATVDVTEVGPIQPRPPIYAMRAEVASPGAPPPPPTEQFSAQRITITAHVNALFGMTAPAK
jgi:uncharacterized protein YggE